MKHSLFISLVFSVFCLVGCGPREVEYSTHESANGSYQIDIPSRWGTPRKVSDLMQIVNGDDGPLVNITRVSYSSLSDYLNSGEVTFSQGTKRKYDYTVKERTENLVAYKVTTPTTMMFSACTIYGFKKLRSGNYVVNVMQVNGDLNYYKQIVEHMIDSLHDCE